MSGSKKVEKDHYLFREGDESDAIYVVKSGKFAITKSKQNSEIVLAEIGPGAMVGEMAFFDSKPRSASCKAMKESEVIILPFKALHAQFQTFPEWCKALMRTVNQHVRDANQRIKNLEKLEPSETDLFPPHTITKLTSILNLVAAKYGKPAEDGSGVEVNPTRLRNYTIQIFQEPTHKMQKLMSAYMELGFMKVEELGEGKQRVVLFKQELLFSFVEWYNDWLFKQEKDRVYVKEEELNILKAIIHFGRKQQPDAKGVTKLSLNLVQNDSMRDLNYLVKVDDVNPFIEKKMISDKIMEESGVYVSFKLDELEKMAPFWDIIYRLKRVTR